MQPTVIDRAGDPRIAEYVGLSDPELRRRVEEDGGFFVAEGPLVVRTLLATQHRVRSVLVTRAQYDALADVLTDLAAPVYVVTPALMRETVGFDLHRGAVATADRYPLPSVRSVLAGATRVGVLERVNDHENLGGLFRNAAAFGIDALLLCPQSSDPLYRRSVRVSIGHVLTVPWTRAAPWPAALHELQAEGFRLVALTPAADALPIDDLVPAAGEKLALLLGAEGPGLSAETLERADLRVRIPTAPGVDSLNVSVAAAIAFHHVTYVRR
ncbi:MAG: rlmB [Actinomycetia bacterium]|nr:rlmB [Actinomycetes bacterium]